MKILILRRRRRSSFLNLRTQTFFKKNLLFFQGPLLQEYKRECLQKKRATLE